MADCGWLMNLLKHIQACSPSEDDRYGLILQAVAEAHKLGLKAGFRSVSRSGEVLRAFIELPGAGQVSWPVPAYAKSWENQSPVDRAKRIRMWTRQSPGVEGKLFD